MGSRRLGSKPTGESTLPLVVEPEERLTCIHERIHCVATHDTADDIDELQEIQIAEFFNTLAGVAIEVAKRTR